jgi:hypothetical protein
MNKISTLKKILQIKVRLPYFNGLRSTKEQIKAPDELVG